MNPLRLPQATVDPRLRLVGWCVGCRHIKRVLPRAPMLSVHMAMGLCDDCEVEAGDLAV